ncbi:hypothetical protein [Streptomyces rhizosphaerihabitans]|uniref:hypothetical protein n=1 Tax=Streptomyces rhizosphaerihabitans TaxID=1266770 RepID=UPI0021C19A26|nr:hypothetical protein [Streptomyces rhizosphaerihabitans]MCT9004635.1 hypothetical protein [Streptomyces rhizosphaerihabitans]
MGFRSSDLRRSGERSRFGSTGPSRDLPLAYGLGTGKPADKVEIKSCLAIVFQRRGCIQAMLDAGTPAEVVAVHSRHSPRSTAFDAYRKKKLSWNENPTAALGLAA